MTRGVRWYLVGSLVLVALAGCKPGWLEEREPWRREAEMACLKAGTVKEGASVALLGPISGPGMCGADFPLKISGLGEEGPLGYADEALRPPGDVPQAAPSYPRAPAYPQQPVYQSPQYPPRSQSPSQSQYPGQYPPNAPFAVNPDYPADTRLPPRTAYPPQPSQDYEPAPPPGEPREPRPYPPPAMPRSGAPNGPISLSPPGYDPPGGDRAGDYQPPLPRYGAPRTVPARNPPPARAYPSPANADEPPYRPPPAERTAPFSPRPGSSEVVPMSPSLGSPSRVAVATTASVSPPATLACPIVSALDRWIADAVQPAAQKWFGQPVTGIRQISAYSCRGMNGNPNAHISEHAFGNALDIASFVLADGRVVTVERGWHGAPEEQGFLRDVQAAACELFTTVLAPGSNVYHYNHIHVDLMRRASGRSICEPGPVGGDEVAARARARYAGGRDGVTGSVPARRSGRRTPYSAYDDEDRRLPDAVPGED
jgi:hypothetical protein